jgi:hypothetical protein
MVLAGQRALTTAVTLVLMGCARPTPTDPVAVDARAGWRAAAAATTLDLLVGRALPAGRRDVWFPWPDSPGWRLVSVQPADDADCAILAPPGAATRACPEPRRPWRRCRMLVARFACATPSAADAAVLRLGFSAQQSPPAPDDPPAPTLPQPTCRVAQEPVPCRWQP